TQVVWKDGRSTDYAEDQHVNILDHIHDLKVVRLRQGFHLLFSSEPDVSVRDVHEKPVMAIEVKAGTDSAGALERLGAAMKSFENDRSLNPRVKTVYVVRAMTPELRARIDETNPFDYTFGLAELLADEDKQRRFAGVVLRAILGRNR
ncbi:MAG: XcyI family restriction endonuclease, partial [Planctomycetaceae bacterium]